MRIDLHNHITTSEGKTLPQLKKLEKQSGREIYIQAIKYHKLDALAVTDYHNIDFALGLSREYPQHILVGAEYRVMATEGITVQVVVLGLTPSLHERLMNARLRGVSHFTSVLKENRLPHFLAHIGLGLPLENRAMEAFDALLPQFEAIEVLDAAGTQESNFAMALARYYGLSMIGGSGHIFTISGRRAYTEAQSASRVDEFYEAIHQKQVRPGLTAGASFHSSDFSLRWESGKEFYRREMLKLWHSELQLSGQLEVGEIVRDFGQWFLSPILQWFPHASHLKQMKESSRKIVTMKDRFVDYLKLKQTQQTFALDSSLEEKIKRWSQEVERIDDCFFP